MRICKWSKDIQKQIDCLKEEQDIQAKMLTLRVNKFLEEQEKKINKSNIEYKEKVDQEYKQWMEATLKSEEKQDAFRKGCIDHNELVVGYLKTLVEILDRIKK